MADWRGGALDDAAIGLFAVGCADPFETDPAVRVHCLWAVEALRAVGARPERDLQPLVGVMVDDTIRAALNALASLPACLTDEPAVIDAIAAAGAALEIAG